ncbi:hypothetical protein [Mucilaginibacter ginsenosidivorans]|uniref:Uncharacterized protein n=1 Tax=Mucilaginibacter ginsenosidivorans TaxID=398053 RepID=A0A5B8USI6_9SPHI|nr:hypothetical protein [Mucilaginibacter ginsenosidivorans]QEC61882.1 hypothetical protein FRZ54_04545 [Mucilaginibacter ginsenosidivorans]
MKRTPYLLLALTLVLHISCKRYTRHGLPFADVKGIEYTEVRRIFDNGQVFDKQGYQLEPVWKFHFISDDSVQVFSPKKQKYYGFHVYYDHDLIFNMIDSWLQLLKMTPDSIVFRSLRVNEKREILLDDEGSKVYMTFYSDKYLKTKSAQTIKQMGLPTRKDTAFISERSKLANTIMDSAFSARQPVVLKSNSPYVTAERLVKPDDPLSDMDPSEDYLYPEYNITVHHAYEDFAYSFSAFVDAQGVIHFRKSTIFSYPEFEKSNTQAIKALLSGYVARYVNVTPGSTLGIPHTSVVLINLTGKKQ